MGVCLISGNKKLIIAGKTHISAVNRVQAGQEGGRMQVCRRPGGMRAANVGSGGLAGVQVEVRAEGALGIGGQKRRDEWED